MMSWKVVSAPENYPAAIWISMLQFINESPGHAPGAVRFGYAKLDGPDLIARHIEQHVSNELIQLINVGEQRARLCSFAEPLIGKKAEPVSIPIRKRHHIAQQC
jgi:hypothetical protein